MKSSSYDSGMVRNLKEICQPLFEKTEISYFECAHILNEDNSFEWFSTYPERTELWASSPLNKPMRSIFSAIRGTALRYYFWNNSQHYTENQIERKSIENVLSLSSTEFNIAHGFVIFEDLGKHSNIYSFGTSANNEHLQEFYVNNLDLMENFVFYFKDKSSKLLKDSIFSLNCYDEKDTMRKLESINLDIKRFFLTSSLSGNVYLTGQEVKSVLLLSKGHTLKEISKLLDLSTRTIESYLKSAKGRLKLKTNNQLIALFWKSSLARLALGD